MLYKAFDIRFNFVNNTWNRGSCKLWWNTMNHLFEYGYIRKSKYVWRKSPPIGPMLWLWNYISFFLLFFRLYVATEHYKRLDELTLWAVPHKPTLWTREQYPSSQYNVYSGFITSKWHMYYTVFFSILLYINTSSRLDKYAGKNKRIKHLPCCNN